MPVSYSSSDRRTGFIKCKLTLFLLLTPLFFYAQTLTGLWIGAVSNDSTTIRKDQSFEIALTEYRGKVYGYSRSEFIVEDVLYYVVKRVKGTINGDVCEVADDEIIAYNFPTKLDKGVKVTSVFRRNGSDSAWYLDGTWKTNKTRNFYSVTGKISLAEEKDLAASKIFPHLEELKKADDVAFYKERKEGQPIVKLVKPERDDKVSYVNVNPDLTASQVSVVPGAERGFTQSAQSFPQRTQRSNDQKDEDPQRPIAVKKTEERNPDVATLPTGTVGDKNSTTIEEPIEKEKKIAPTYTGTSPAPEINSKSDDGPNADLTNSLSQSTLRKEKSAKNSQVSSNDEETKRSIAVKSEEKNPDVAPRLPGDVARNENAPKSEPQPEYADDMNVDLKKLRQSQVAVQTVQQPAIKPTEQKQTTEVKLPAKKEEAIVVAPIPKVKTTPAQRNGAAAAVNDRRTEVSQVVNFKSDSLQIALYDNGQIDGDTVSVLMNGEVILSKQGLKASAIRHTIHLAPGTEEFHIVLYAENLGEFPPNTGVMTVRDGNDVYNLRFSSDFQKNTGIVFRRKQ